MVSLKKQCLSEFLCGLFVGFFGLGCIVVKRMGVIDLLQFSLLFGLAIAFVVVIFNPMSGAQFNPGVTLAMVLTKRQDKKTLLPYIGSQLLGWFAGAAMVYGVFYFQIDKMMAGGYKGVEILTQAGAINLLTCACQNQISAIPLEFILTGFMVMLILACNDQRIVNKPGKALFPLVLALYITFAVTFAGTYSGAALNLSRDLGPRLFATIWGAIKGYDVSVAWNYDCLIYLFVPAAGAVAGAFIYDYGIARLLPKDKEIIDTKGVINDNYVLEEYKSSAQEEGKKEIELKKVPTNKPSIKKAASKKPITKKKTKK